VVVVIRKGTGWLVEVEAGVSGDAALEESWLQAMAECFALFCVKQRGYSPTNINRMGIRGIAARVREKLDRVESLLRRREVIVGDEAMDDTLLDIADYGVIALLVHRGDWPASSDGETVVQEIERRLAEGEETRVVLASILERGG